MKTLLLWVGLLFCSHSVIAEEAPSNTERPLNWNFSAEAGGLWQTRNDFRIPSLSGTLVSLDDTKAGPFFSYRFYLGHRWGEERRHEVRALWAPLSLSVSPTFSSAVNFQNQTFAANTATNATYQFNSYRLTYRYALYLGDSWRWWVGLTGKIRDAKIGLSQGVVSAEKKDVGFVPLLHVHGEWLWTETWKMILDVDALAAPQGRAEDILLATEWTPLPQWSFFGGYRMVEGGADNRDVFTFAWLHYLTAGARYSW